MVRRRLKTFALTVAAAAVAGLPLAILLPAPWGGAAGLGLVAALAVVVAWAQERELQRTLGGAMGALAEPRTGAAPLDGEAALSEGVRRLAAERQALGGEGRRLRALLESMEQGVAVIEEGRIRFANPALARLLGDDGPLVGRTPLELLRSPALDAAIAAARRGEPGASRDVTTATGRILHLRASQLPGDGALALVLLDVTEARAIDRLRREFVANASHELRTPVAAIRAATETLTGDGLSPADRVRFQAMLGHHVERLARLVDDLLDLSRAEDQAPLLRAERVDLVAAVGAVAALFAERAAARQVRLRFDCPPGLPELLADPAAVEQVLVNLIDNAIKYGRPGTEVVVGARALPGEPRRVRLEVADQGPGIAAEHLPRLFERFYRVDPARSRALGGTGLGLAIVKHLVQAQGGSVAVASTVGEGSRFSVTFVAA